MKKLLLPLIMLVCIAALQGTTFTSKSLLFADSYMLRASGADANYWNPALLNPSVHDLWLPAVNTGIFVGNNALNIDLYNYIMDHPYLADADKQKILDSMDGKLTFNLGGQIGIFGITMGNIALSSSVHLAARAAISEDYLRLLLYGNGDGSQVYEFTEEDNYLDAMSYSDITLGVGDIRLPLPDKIPDIKFGFAASALGGIGDAHTEEFYGMFYSSLDGLNVQQDVLLRTGAAGYGFKGLLGLYSEPVKGLSAGITLDNVLGFIKWGLIREDLRYHFEVDSLYAIDIQDDFYTDEYTETKTAAYTTALPPELRLAALYKTNQVSISADFVKGFGNSADVSKDSRLAFGLELTPLPILPIHLGYNMGNDSYPWRVSYGVGLDLQVLQFGFGFQSIESILPGNSSKGISFAMYLNIRI